MLDQSQSLIRSDSMELSKPTTFNRTQSVPTVQVEEVPEEEQYDKQSAAMFGTIVFVNGGGSGLKNPVPLAPYYNDAEREFNEHKSIKRSRQSRSSNDYSYRRSNLGESQSLDTSTIK